MKFEKLEISSRDFCEKYFDIMEAYGVEEESEQSTEKDLEKYFYFNEFEKLSWDFVIDANITKMTFKAKGKFRISTSSEYFDMNKMAYECKNPKGLTLKDWSEGVYRMKTKLHDFDKESIVEVKFDFENNVCEIIFDRA